MTSGLNITLLLKTSEVENKGNKAHPCLKYNQNKALEHFLSCQRISKQNDQVKTETSRRTRG